MHRDKIYSEIQNHLISYVLLIIIFKITFSHTDLFQIIIGITKFYLILMLPALLLSYLIFDNLEVLERIAISYFIGLIGLAIFTYYSGIFLSIGIMASVYSASIITSLISISLLIIRDKKGNIENKKESTSE